MTTHTKWLILGGEKGGIDRGEAGVHAVEH